MSEKPTHWKRLMLGKIEGKRRRGLQRMRWLDSVADSMDMNLSKLWEIVKDRGGWRAAAHGVTKSQTQLSDWTTTVSEKASSSLIKIEPSFIRLPWWLRRQNVCLQCRRPGFNPWVRKIPWRRKWQSTPVFLPGKSHGQRSLVGYSPWVCKESDTTEWLHLHHLLNLCHELHS